MRHVVPVWQQSPSFTGRRFESCRAHWPGAAADRAPCARSSGPAVAIEEVDDGVERLTLHVVDDRTTAVVGLGEYEAVRLVAPRAPLGVVTALGEQVVGEPEHPLELVLVAADHERGNVDRVEAPRHRVGIGDPATGVFGAADL